jgi:hypothetical protein
VVLINAWLLKPFVWCAFVFVGLGNRRYDQIDQLSLRAKENLLEEFDFQQDSQFFEVRQFVN